MHIGKYLEICFRWRLWDSLLRDCRLNPFADLLGDTTGLPFTLCSNVFLGTVGFTSLRRLPKWAPYPKPFKLNYPLLKYISKIQLVKYVSGRNEKAPAGYSYFMPSIIAYDSKSMIFDTYF